MTFYTIATKINQVYGHGDQGYEYHICPVNAYHTGSVEFHPLFTTRAAAETYKKGLKFNHDLIIVPLRTKK